MSDQPMREMRSDELVEAMENLHQYPRLIAERAYAEGLAAATPAPLDIDAPDNANAATTSANATPAPLDAETLLNEWVAMDARGPFDQFVVDRIEESCRGSSVLGGALAGVPDRPADPAGSSRAPVAIPTSSDVPQLPTAEDYQRADDALDVLRADVERMKARRLATPAPLDVLVAALVAIDAKVQKYAEQEADSAAHKEWTLADRWRYLAMGNAEAVESIRAALKENRGE